MRRRTDAGEAAARLHDADAARHGRGEAFEMAHDQGADEGVHDRRRRPLVLPVLGQEPVRERDVESRARERASQAAFVLAARVAVEEAHGDRGRAPAVDRGGRARRLARRERLLDRAVGEDALAHADPQPARHERQRAPRLERVEHGPRLATDLDHVLEPGGGEEDDACAAALEQRVRRDRRPVVQPRRPAERRESRAHGRGGIPRRRADLQDAEPARDDGHQVGEGAAGVDADDGRAARQDADFSLAGFASAGFASAAFSDACSDPFSDLPPDAADSPPSFFAPLSLPARA